MINTTIKIPGSKSISNRALILSSISKGKTVLSNFLWCDDSLYLLNALNCCGIDFQYCQNGDLEIIGDLEILFSKYETLFLGNSGTSIRFLAPVLALSSHTVTLTGNQAMLKRPIQDLAKTLRELGAKTETQQGLPPISIQGPLIGGYARISTSISSQFLSGILMALPLVKENNSELEIYGDLVSYPYVNMTLQMIQAFGATIKQDNHFFYIPKEQHYTAISYYIESDFSSASYFIAAVSLLGGKLRLQGMHYDKSIQGDKEVLDIIKKMGGCDFYQEEGCLIVESSGETLLSGEFDMGNCSDMVLTIGILAACAEGVTRLYNIENIRYKETDRIAALAQGLSAIGISTQITNSSIEIKGEIPHSGIIETKEDHRMAMAFAILGLKFPGIIVDDPDCCRKTFPAFFELLKSF